MKPKVKMTDRINGLIKGKATVAPQLSQRDQYAKAMNKAQKKGGSNGVGVGY